MLNEVKIKYSVDASELSKATQEFDKLTAEEKQANIALDKFQENLRQTGRDSKEGLGSVGDGLEGANKSAIKFGATIQKNQASVRAFTTSLRTAGDVAIKAGNQASAGLAGVDAQLRKNQASARAFQQSLAGVGQAGKKTSSSSSDLLGNLSNLVNIGGKFLIYKQIYDTGVALANASAKAESMAIQFKFITGTAQGASAQLAYISNLSRNLGIDLKTATEAYKSFATNSVLVGQSLSETNYQFEAIAMASRSAGLSAEQTEGAFLAVSQMLSKGKVSAEELRGQLAERLPGSFSLFAKSVGLTEQELNKMLETGDVLAKETLPLFATELKQAFGQQQLESMDSMGAKMSRLGTSFQIFFKNLATIATPVLQVIVDEFNALFMSINKIYDKITLSDAQFAQKQRKTMEDNVRANAEILIIQKQAEIALERGVAQKDVTRADASRRLMQQTQKGYEELQSRMYAKKNLGTADPLIEQELNLGIIQRNIFVAEINRQKQNDATREKIKEASAKSARAKAQKDADKAEKERLAGEKKKFDNEMNAIEEQKKISQIELENSKKTEEQKALDALLIEEKYLKDSIALKEKYAKKEPKLATDVTKGLNIQKAELVGVQQDIPFAGYDIRIGKFQKDITERNRILADGFKDELKINESQRKIRMDEIDAMAISEQKKKKLKIEGEISANEGIMAINMKYREQGLGDAIDAVDTQNAELIAKNKALQNELTAIDKEGNAEREQIVSDYGQHIQSVFNGAMNLFQQNLTSDLEASKTRYDEELRLAGDNKQKITEIKEKARNEEREIKRKQFEAQKVQAIADVVFQTAPIIAKYGADIFTVPLALVAVASQVAQIGFILSQPVPEFAEGTKGKPFKGGRAMVGERGIEKVVTQSGKVYYTPPTATLVDLPQGAQVIPNHQLPRQELFYASNLSRSQGGNNLEPISTGINELGGILKSLPIHQINMDEKGFEKYIRTPRRSTKILNSQFPMN